MHLMKKEKKDKKSLIVDDDFNEEISCRDNSKLQASMILFNIATLIATNVKIIFIESNDK